MRTADIPLSLACQANQDTWAKNKIEIVAHWHSTSSRVNRMIAKVFPLSFRHTQLAPMRCSPAPKAADGMNYIFQQPLTSHQTPWLLVLEE